MKYFKLCIITLFLFGCIRNKPVKTGLEGEKLPSFTVLLTDSITYFNTLQIPGDKKLVVFLFSPQCPYCKAQLKEIMNNQDKFSHIQFLALTSWPFSDMKDFYDKYQLKKYRNIIVANDYTGSFIKYFHTQGVPFTAIYNQKKELSAAYLGKIKATTIARY